MDYRNLLELAALSANKIPDSFKDSPSFFDGVLDSWKPLEDDGVAFRLANYHSFCVAHSKSGLTDYKLSVLISDNSGPNSKVLSVRHYTNKTDTDLMTRQAIVEAAAQIGAMI